MRPFLSSPLRATNRQKTCRSLILPAQGVQSVRGEK
jgi:hypothetical protein